MQPKLYIIPTPLGASETPCLLAHELALISDVTDFVVETEKKARAHLKHFSLNSQIRELNLQTLNEHSKPEELIELINPLKEGRNLGLISDAGCPAIADPGANLVSLAHQHGYHVYPLIGPSSLLLAMMASGANGQRFTFNGYLPTDKTERINALKKLEYTSIQNNETQIFIETPYRNDVMLEDAINNLKSTTRLCVACDLTLPEQFVLSQPISLWKKSRTLPNLKKRPTIFVLHHN